LRRGIQIETHAIGDRGNRIMLDLYERACSSVPQEQRAVAQPRWRIEHAQILSPTDIPRFAKLGVIASMQPSHAIGDLYFAPNRLGPDRLAGAYAWHSLLDSDLTVLASDIMTIPEAEIPHAHVVMTVIDGRVAYAADDAPRIQGHPTRAVPVN
jgi:predicted amidohydrolase YtcJ